MFAAAILAGGRGRRLGGVDKGSLTIGQESLLDRQVSLLRRLTPHTLIVTSDTDRVRMTGVAVVADRIRGAGALGGLYTALVEAPTEQVLVIACDMPFLTVPFLAHLAARGADADAVIPRDARGRHPLCASYRRSVAAHIRTRIDSGDLRVGEALQGLDVRELDAAELAPFNHDGRLLTNINTPDDLEHARRAEHDDALRFE